MSPREIDPATGLWKLPEGFFFRVAPWNYERSSYSIHVEVRRTRRFRRSTVLGDSLAEATAESILQAAGYAMDRAEASVNKNVNIHDRDRFLGDYPPKTLPNGETR